MNQNRRPAVSIYRRRLLTTVLFLPASLALSNSVAQGSTSKKGYHAFFNDEERRFIEVATARLIPEDNDGMGATTAAVAFFIDRQLAGPYGRAETWYMQEPWLKGVPEQGYQLAYSPAALYRAAIHYINSYCQKTYQSSFADLPPDRQDEFLHQMEDGKLKLGDIPSEAFFTIFLQNTQEGFLADPMYGGNRNFTGWKLVGFPGPRYNYVDEITRHGEPYRQATVGLLGRDGTRVLPGDSDGNSTQIR